MKNKKDVFEFYECASLNKDGVKVLENEYVV
jgi:hypothetical protein